MFLQLKRPTLIKLKKRTIEFFGTAVRFMTRELNKAIFTVISFTANGKREIRVHAFLK